jgi:hypothetical protein
MRRHLRALAGPTGRRPGRPRGRARVTPRVPGAGDVRDWEISTSSCSSSQASSFGCLQGVMLRSGALHRGPGRSRRGRTPRWWRGPQPRRKPRASRPGGSRRGPPDSGAGTGPGVTGEPGSSTIATPSSFLRTTPCVHAPGAPLIGRVAPGDTASEPCPAATRNEPLGVLRCNSLHTPDHAFQAARGRSGKCELSGSSHMLSDLLATIAEPTIGKNRRIPERLHPRRLFR